MDNIQITTECIKTISNLGSTSYQNICNGNFSTVPWGVVDWFNMSYIFAFIIVLTYLIWTAYKH